MAALKKCCGGLVLAIALGLLAWWLAGMHEAMDALVVGIILGMVMRTIIGDRAGVLPGLALAPRIFIPLGVVFYGINLRFNKLAEVPGVLWLQLLVGTVAIFAIAMILGKRLRMRESNSLLIAIGTAICGASAIAIATPVVDADSEDAGASLITITIFGLFGLLLYPLALTFFPLTETAYAALCATTLHMTGLVKSAAMAMGDGCLRLAISIKMARTAMIIPIIGFLCWHPWRGKAGARGPIMRRIPWFMWAFVAVGLAMSFLPGAAQLIGVLKPWAGIFFTIALTSIGLTVDLKKMINVGGAPLIVGLACWIAAIGIYLIAFQFLG